MENYENKMPIYYLKKGDWVSYWQSTGMLNRWFYSELKKSKIFTYS